MDTISSTAFGISINSQKFPDNPFVKNAKEFFAKDFSFIFPLLGKTIVEAFRYNFKFFSEKRLKPPQ